MYYAPFADIGVILSDYIEIFTIKYDFDYNNMIINNSANFKCRCTCVVLLYSNVHLYIVILLYKL